MTKCNWYWDWTLIQNKKRGGKTRLWMCVVGSNPTLRSREKVISMNMLFHLILYCVCSCVCVCCLIFTLSGLKNNLVCHWENLECVSASLSPRCPPLPGFSSASLSWMQWSNKLLIHWQSEWAEKRGVKRMWGKLCMCICACHRRSFGMKRAARVSLPDAILDQKQLP